MATASGASASRPTLLPMSIGAGASIASELGVPVASELGAMVTAGSGLAVARAFESTGAAVTVGVGARLASHTSRHTMPATIAIKGASIFALFFFRRAITKKTGLKGHYELRDAPSPAQFHAPRVRLPLDRQRAAVPREHRDKIPHRPLFFSARVPFFRETTKARAPF